MRATLRAYGRSLAAPLLTAMCLASCDSGAAPPQKEVAKSFSVYALSRGSGVPPAAREAQQKVQELLDADRARGVDVNVRTIRLGLEGERKLCVTYVDAQEAARTLERVRALVQGVDLVNVVVESCGPAQ